jgi:hypothetical protein
MAQLVRRGVAPALALALLLVQAPRPAAATDAIAEWCEVDPALVVQTPTGRVVVLHVTNYGLGLEHLRAVRRAEISSTVRPVGNGPAPGEGRRGTARPAEAVLVEVVVAIPLGAGGQAFPTRSVVSTKPAATGTVLAAARGESGRTMRMEFRLDVP